MRSVAVITQLTGLATNIAGGAAPVDDFASMQFSSHHCLVGS